MNGKKAKALRKMAAGIGPQLPEVEYIKQKRERRYNLGMGKIKVMPFEQVFLGKCQRKIYKSLKRVYRLGLKQGISHG